MSLNPDTLVSVHCYSGDQEQIHTLRRLYEHHECPIVVMSPSDSPVTSFGGHWCWSESGQRAYVGQASLDRQFIQMRQLLEYKKDDGTGWWWFLMHDSDSVCLDAKLPDYLYAEDNVLWSNLVDDFRKPGESWQGMPPWPKDYHAGFPQCASQPPYFLSRNALTKMVENYGKVKCCPITPFIDWSMVVMAVEAGVELKPFRHGASCETKTAHGKAVMKQCIAERGAMMVHAIKTPEARDLCVSSRKEYLSRQ
jgi:hypothetical protein